MESTQIQEITPQGIVYTDADGTQKIISFQECFITFMKLELAALAVTERILASRRTTKRVGEIDYIGDPIDPHTSEMTAVSQPFVQLYDTQLTRFEFTDPEECAEFHQRVTRSGWSLFDLSG